MFSKANAGYIDDWEDYYDQMTTGRSCSNCKHRNVMPDYLPCVSCRKRNKWESGELKHDGKAKRVKRADSIDNTCA